MKILWDFKSLLFPAFHLPRTRGLRCTNSLKFTQVLNMPPSVHFRINIYWYTIYILGMYELLETYMLVYIKNCGEYTIFTDQVLYFISTILDVILCSIIKLHWRERLLPSYLLLLFPVTGGFSFSLNCAALSSIHCKSFNPKFVSNSPPCALTL